VVSPAISAARTVELLLCLAYCGGGSSVGGPQLNPKRNPSRNLYSNREGEFGFCDGGNLSYLDPAVKRRRLLLKWRRQRLFVRRFSRAGNDSFQLV
jgi:hypothetical protein